MLIDSLHSYSKTSDISCGGGTGTCSRAQVFEAEVSSFHTVSLLDASRKIQAILDEIEPDRDGRELCFLNVRNGVLLAWATHVDKLPLEGITADDDFETIAEALGLVTEEGAAVRV